MLLSALIKDLPGARMEGPDVSIADIAHDSRKVTPGTLFLAVPSVGGTPDSGGYRFIDAARAAGAVAVVAQAPLEGFPGAVVVVPDARAAMADVAVRFFDHPSEKMHLFGVTGTDGKTTTTYLLAEIIEHLGYSSGLIGTVETRIGSQRSFNEERNTTPESLDLQRLLRRMIDAGVLHVAMEASSHALALDRLRGCVFRGCAFTNVTGDHLEFHGSFDAYLEAKLRLFTATPQAPAVLNRDDPHYERFEMTRVPERVDREVTRGNNILSYGFSPEARFRAEIVEARSNGTTFHVIEGGRRLATLDVPLPGRFNVLNALAAVLLATLSVGPEYQEIGEALRLARRPPGRMQDVSSGTPFRVVVDYAHTPHALRSVLSDLRAQTSGRLIAVFGAAGNRDRGKRPELARIAADFTDFFVITNEDPFDEDPDAIIAEVASGAPHGESGTRYLLERERGDAIKAALERAQPGDTVVITGKGHEQSIAVGGERVPWSDADAVRAILEERR